MNTLDSRRLIAAILLVAVALTGCRTPVETEGDLSVELFERPGNSLTTSSSGQWFVVARRGTSPERFLTVEYSGQTHLFATRRQGPRSAEILPLTRVDIDWFNEALQSTPLLEFHDGVDAVSVDDVLGVWAGGDDDGIRWLGPAPEVETRGVVVPVELEVGSPAEPGVRGHRSLPQGALSASLPAQVEGLVDVDADGVGKRKGAFPADRGPYFVLPDGATSETGPRAASFVADFPFSDDEFAHWDYHELEGPEATSSAEIAQLAGETGVEVLFAPDGDDIRVGFARDGGAPARGEAPFPVAVAESGFVIDGDADDELLRYSLQVVDDLYRDHPLSASYHLRQLDAHDAWSVDGAFATRLRHQDLVAAADYAPWMRSVLTDGAEGMGPEVNLYLVRALVYMGRWDAVVRYGDRAGRLFSTWPRRPAAMGMARTRTKMAFAHRRLDEPDDAWDALSRAREDFRRAGDPYRAALVDRRARLWEDSPDFAPVVEELLDAGARYEARRTELLAAAADLEAHRLEDARIRLENWNEQFGGEAGTRLLAFSQALWERLDWLDGRRFEPGELAERFERARTSRAWEAIVAHALTRHERRAMGEYRDAEKLGQPLLEGTLRSDAELFAPEVDDALGVLCTDVVFAGEADPGGGLAERYCNRRIDALMQTPDGLLSVIDGGYRLIQHGRLIAAEQLESRLFEYLPESDVAPLVVAEAHLHRAARLEELRLEDDPDDGPQLNRRFVDEVERAFDVLRDGLDEELAGEVLLGLGDQFDSRGMDRLTRAMYGASRSASAQARRHTDEYRAALRLAVVRHESRQWTELAEMDNVQSPLHAARIDLYRAHARAKLDGSDEGEPLTDQAIEGAEEFGEFQRMAIDELAARLAVERGDLRRAEEHIDRGLNRLAALSEARAGRIDAAILDAQLTLLLARIARAEQRWDHAATEAHRALTTIDDVDIGEAPHIRREIVEANAELVVDEQQYHQLVDELDDLRRRLPADTAPGVRRDLLRTLSGLLVDDDRPQEATRRMRGAFGQGLGLASTRRHHHCAATVNYQFARNDDLAAFHRHRCTAADPDSPRARIAELFASLGRTEASVSYRTELAEHLRDSLPGDAHRLRARLKWIIEFARPQRDSDPERREELRDRFQRDDDGEIDPAQQLEHTVEYVEFLLDTGDYGEADRLLETETEVFFDDELRARDRWVILRVDSMVRQLRPFDAIDYAERAMSEQPLESPARRARLLALIATAHLQLGQHFPALRTIWDAADDADELEEIAAELDDLESMAHQLRFPAEPRDASPAESTDE